MHICTRTLTYIHTHVHTYMYTVRVCIYMCLSVCLCVCVCYVCVCIHVCVGVCSCHMNLIFMVNYTYRYFRDATLNICKCPSKDLSIEDTGWQSNCSFFQEELAYYKMSVMCVSMMYDYTYLYRYTRIIIIQSYIIRQAGSDMKNAINVEKC